jgi:hypothetical protein
MHSFKNPEKIHLEVDPASSRSKIKTMLNLKKKTKKQNSSGLIDPATWLTRQDLVVTR